MEKNLPLHGGKYGKLRRPSRAHKRKRGGFSKSKKTNTEPVPLVEDNVNQDVNIDPVENNLDTTQCTAVSGAASKEPEIQVSCLSSSAKKIHTVNVDDVDANSSCLLPDCFLLFHSKLLLDFINKMVLSCPDCGCTVHVLIQPEAKKGLAHFFKAECHCTCNQICEWSVLTCTSPKVNSKVFRGVKPFEINLRMMMAFRELGRGHAGIVQFCKLMNIPPPMDSKTYRKSFTRLYSSYKKISEKSMLRAATEAKGTDIDEAGVSNVIASFDGTWQKRGYSSLNGVVAAVSNGKVVDAEVLCKVCRECKYWNKKKNTKEFEEWSLHHKCQINHQGSSGSMEVTGVRSIFKRSVESRKLRYTTYLGDGDSKSFQTVLAENVYPGFDIVKAECIGHVQKRVGARLRAYKEKYKGVILVDGKPLTGAGRMTEKVMNTLQNYYGMIIRSNVGNLYQMKKGIGSIMKHCSQCLDSDGNDQPAKRHMYCPTK